MLTVNDKEEIKETVYSAIGEFIDVSLKPYLENLERYNSLIRKDIHELKENVTELKQNVTELKQNVTELKRNQQVLTDNLVKLTQIVEGHEKRISKVEVLTRS